MSDTTKSFYRETQFLVIVEVAGEDDAGVTLVLRGGHVGDGGLEHLRVGHGALGRVEGGEDGVGRAVVSGIEE